MLILYRRLCSLSVYMFCIFTTTAMAQQPENKVTSDDKPLNVPVRVLQNRYFLKALRPEISVFGGSVLNESYSSTYSYGARAGLFLTEYLGVEYTYSGFSASDSTDLKAIKNFEYCPVDKPCTEKMYLEPSFTRLKSSHAGVITFAPIYSKISLFSKAILYSDIVFSIGGAQVKTDQGSKTAIVGGIGQRFYFAKSFNVRFDATDHIFEETRINKGVSKKSTRHAWVVSLGASAFLWESQ